MPHTIGERIVYARELRGMSQGDLARASEIAATQLSRYETGRTTPRKLAAHRLATALAVKLTWLETGDGALEEYGASDGSGLTIWINEELSARLGVFAHYNGLTLEEAIAEFLDSPLSVYSPDILPSTPEEQEKLRRSLKANSARKHRLQVLSKKVRVHPGK